MISQDLKTLEERSIYIIREAKLKFKNVAALWSMGKDSTTMLALTRKAFLGKIPFPVIHIDNGIDFPETYAFRESLAKKWNFKVIVGRSEIKPDSVGSACCGQNKPETLKKIMKEYGFDALIVSIRRDEHSIRAKERYMSPRNENFEWKYKDQPAELWDDYSSKEEGTKGHIRVHPLLDWTELDVWRYVKQERIPINPLYFSRNGFRYRSLGCTHCTVALKSNAKTVDDIVKELETTKVEERSGRSMDKEREYVMQRLRALGYL
ncbi:MAG: sulfate adenylyltransferase subunit CysD [Candidatus Micrarchaeota archaeon]|nr:sulfate adenylyltransferase subunit CysD [Candidatus Micrarchaeota archaeon]